MLEVKQTAQFKRDLKLCAKRHYDLQLITDPAHSQICSGNKALGRGQNRSRPSRAFTLDLCDIALISGEYRSPSNLRSSRLNFEPINTARIGGIEVGPNLD